MQDKIVIKRDGSEVPFDETKIGRWAKHASRQGVNWESLQQETVEALPSKVTTQEIHETMIDICVLKRDLNYSRIAARLKYAELRKNMTHVLGMNDKTHSFEELYNKYLEMGIWKIGPYKPEYSIIYEELYDERMEYWQIKQWFDKYGISVGHKNEKRLVETPHMGAIAIAIAVHEGDIDMIRTLATGIVKGKLNMPTPVINGCRNGDWNTISCCVIEGGDTIDSIGVALDVAYKMTAKKAGIGIRMNTRSLGDSVKNDTVTHLGKKPIYASIEKLVKMFTQVSRGGSATTTFSVYDPEIMSLLLLKTQRIPEPDRIDKIDYSMAYDENFIKQVVENGTIQTVSIDGTLGKEYKARDILKSFLTARQETGRVYCVNLDEMNNHTPFISSVNQSNLCLHEDTLIDIEHEGKMTIKDFTEKFSSYEEPVKVLSWKDNKPSYEFVSAAGITGEVDEMMELEDEFGNIVKCTLNHLIHTENRGWVEAQHLTLDDDIISLNV